MHLIQEDNINSPLLRVEKNQQKTSLYYTNIKTIYTSLHLRIKDDPLVQFCLFISLNLNSPNSIFIYFNNFNFSIVLLLEFVKYFASLKWQIDYLTK